MLSPVKATFTRTCDYVTHAIKNRERFSVACVALFTRTCVNSPNSENSAPNSDDFLGKIIKTMYIRCLTK